MVHTRKLRAGWGDRVALDGVSVVFRPQATTVVMGPGGSGKSTLVRVLAPLPDEAAPWVEGAVLPRARKVVALRQAIAPGRAGHGRARPGLARERLDELQRLLASDADLVLLDEPDVGLDESGHDELIACLDAHRGRRTIAVVTHHVGLARRVADWAVLLIDGLVVESGQAQHLFDHPRRHRTADFLRTGC